MKKRTYFQRLRHRLFKQLCKLTLYIIGLIFLFTLVLGSEYSFSLRRASIVYKQQKSSFGKLLKGVEAVKYLAKLF